MVLMRHLPEAWHQVLMRIFDPDFSSASYGFRPARRAHQVVLAAKANVASGRRWMVDMNLEQCFDCVSHDVLIVKGHRRGHAGPARLDTLFSAGGNERRVRGP